LSQEVGNSIAGPPIGYPPGRHLGSSRRGTGTTLDGGRRPGFAEEVKLHRVGTYAKVDRWRALIDYPNPAYSCMTVRGSIPADLSDGVGKVYNLYRV
jgi:hypothetical protein